MISGYSSKSYGTIWLLGLDSEADRSKVKKLLGVCPQINPLYSYLSVYEHLELYAWIKEAKTNIEVEADEILKDLDLYHKKHYMAGDLSGG